MSYHVPAHPKRLNYILSVFLLSVTLVSSHESASSSHQNRSPHASTLKIEAKESGASITLGKDLILGPSISTRAPSLVTNSSITNSNDITATKIDSLVIPTIIGRVSSGERSGSVSRKPVSRDVGSQGSHIANKRYWTSKEPKTSWKTDSYLDALKHSHTSDDPREGIVRVDSKNRREYVHGPVYKPETEYNSYAPKSPRIAYGGPAASPGNSYPQYKPSMDYNDRYGVPQNHYGPPQNSYGPPPQDDSSFYPQSSSNGPAGNSYPSPQQGEARGIVDR